MTGAEHGAFMGLNNKLNNIMLSMANASDVAFYKAKYEDAEKRIADLQKQLEEKQKELEKIYGYYDELVDAHNGMHEQLKEMRNQGKKIVD